MLSVDTNSFRHLPRRSSNNCDLQFANCDKQTYRLKENYSIDDCSSSACLVPLHTSLRLSSQSAILLFFPLSLPPFHLSLSLSLYYPSIPLSLSPSLPPSMSLPSYVSPRSISHTLLRFSAVAFVARLRHCLFRHQSLRSLRSLHSLCQFVIALSS